MYTQEFISARNDVYPEKIVKKRFIISYNNNNNEVLDKIPVCPYAKIQALYPLNAFSKTSVPRQPNTSS